MVILAYLTDACPGEFSLSIVCLNINSDTLRMVVQADLYSQPRSSACWTAQLLSAFQGLRGCELYVRADQTGRAFPLQEFTADLKHRMRGVWRDADLVDPNTHNNKLATYHTWFAIPFLEMSVCRLLYHGIFIMICPNMLGAISVDFANVRTL